jgi:hypothetical protein
MKRLAGILCFIILFCTAMPASAADKVQIMVLNYRIVNALHDGLAQAHRVNSAGIWQASGFIDTKGKWSITNNGNISDFYEGIAISAPSDQVSYINKAGKTIFLLSKNMAVGGAPYLNTDGYFHEGRAIVSRKGNNHAVGAIDKKGKLIIPCEYWALSDFSNGYAIAAKNKKMGLIDLNGKVIVPFVYEYGTVLADGFAFSKNSNFWRIYEKPVWFSYLNEATYDIYDVNAKLLIADSSEVVNMDKGVIITREPHDSTSALNNHQYKMLDTSGKVLYTAPDSKFIGYLGEGMYTLNESYYYVQLMDSTGKLVNNTEFGFIHPFSGNYAVVEEKVDRQGENLINKSAKYGIIDKKGTLIVPYKYNLPATASQYDHIIENGFAFMEDAATKKCVLITLPKTAGTANSSSTTK